MSLKTEAGKFFKKIIIVGKGKKIGFNKKGIQERGCFCSEVCSVMRGAFLHDRKLL